MYNSERYPSDYAVCQGMQAAFEDLLIDYKVRNEKRPGSFVCRFFFFFLGCVRWSPAERRGVPGAAVPSRPLRSLRQVDVALYGHYHSYQRTCPVYQNECVDGGLIHITVGSAGAWLDLVGFYDVRRRDHGGHTRGSAGAATAISGLTAADGDGAGEGAGREGDRSSGTPTWSKSTASHA